MTYTKKLAIAGAALVSWLAVPGAAWAQTAAAACPRDPYTGATPSCVRGIEVNRTLKQDPKVLGSEVSRSGVSPDSVSSTTSESSSSSDTLPVTGGDLLGLTAIGLGAVGVGTVFVRRSRRTT